MAYYHNLKRPRRPETPYPEEQEYKPYPKYWVMSGDGHKVSDISPFILEKVINMYKTGIKINSVRNGDLLLKCDTREQTKYLQTINQIVGKPIKVTAHRTMNSTQGIIKCYGLRNMDEAEIAENLKKQYVSKVTRFTIKKDGNIIPIHTYLVTFENINPPEKLKVGYISCEVSKYIQTPLRCKKCQKYGHSQRNCSATAKCYRCGGEEHGDCDNEPRCANCKGPHVSSSKECELYKKEQSIQKLKSEINSTYFDAKKIVEANYRKQGATYADMTKKVTNSSTQTEAVQKTICQPMDLTTNQKTNPWKSNESILQMLNLVGVRPKDSQSQTDETTALSGNQGTNPRNNSEVMGNLLQTLHGAGARPKDAEHQAAKRTDKPTFTFQHPKNNNKNPRRKPKEQRIKSPVRNQNLYSALDGIEDSENGTKTHFEQLRPKVTAITRNRSRSTSRHENSKETETSEDVEEGRTREQVIIEDPKRQNVTNDQGKTTEKEITKATKVEVTKPQAAEGRSHSEKRARSKSSTRKEEKEDAKKQNRAKEQGKQTTPREGSEDVQMDVTQTNGNEERSRPEARSRPITRTQTEASDHEEKEKVREKKEKIKNKEKNKEKKQQITEKAGSDAMEVDTIEPSPATPQNNAIKQTHHQDNG